MLDMTLRRPDHTQEVNRGCVTPSGAVVQVVRIDFQSKSVFLGDGTRIGFVKARKDLGIDPEEIAS